MLKNLKRSILVVSILLELTSTAQQASLPHSANFAASPSIASLAQYADVPVSYYSGRPNISIPLYTIETDNFSLPIQLSYNASGIKVAQEASNVGLGWSLFAGGAITRQTRGAYDFSTFTPLGYFYNRENYDYPLNDMLNYNQVLQNVQTHPRLSYPIYGSIPLPKHERDAEPDLFYYNFAGFSGKFILQAISNGEGKGILLDRKDNLSIYFKILGGTKIFTIKDGQGIQYEFSLVEKSENWSNSGLTSSANDHSYQPRITEDSWLLTKIILFNGEAINFKYKSDGLNGYVFKSVPVKSQYRFIPLVINPCSGNSPDNHYQISFNKSNARILDEIEWSQGLIKCYTSARRDQDEPFSGNGENYRQKIDEIKVFAKGERSNTLVKHYEFLYDYFKNGQSRNRYLNWRLKLLGIQEHPVKNIASTSPKKHTFRYNETYDLPSKNSNNYDHWGYYNRARNIQDIYIPGEDDADKRREILERIKNIFQENNISYDISTSRERLMLDGEDRSPNEEATKTGILTEIKYPTGGTEKFDYELNTYVSKTEDDEEPHELVHRRASVAFAYDPSSQGNPFNYEDHFVVHHTLEDYELSLSYTRETIAAIQNSRIGYPIRLELYRNGTLVKTFSCDYSNDNPTLNGGCSQRYILEPLSPGNYTLKLNMNSYLTNGNIQGIVVSGAMNYDERVLITEDDQELAQNIAAGGLRIRRIVSDKNIREFSYSQENSLLSSGKLLGDYNYFDIRILPYLDFRPECSGSSSLIGKSIFYVKQSNSNFPLTGALTGNIVGYSTVEEKIINPVNGSASIRNIYHYSNTENVIKDFGVPAEEIISNGTLTKTVSYGKVIRTTIHKRDPIGLGSYTPIHAVNYNYDKGITNHYKLFSNFFPVIETVTEERYLNFNIQDTKVTERFEYNDFDGIVLLKETSKLDSMGDEYITHFTYPLNEDLSVPSNPTFMQTRDKLIQQNHLNIPLYTQTALRKKDNRQLIQLSHHHTVFKDWGNNANNSQRLILPEKEWSLKGTLPSNFQMDEDIGYSKYDTYGNPEEAFRYKGSHFIYIWGYHHQYPIALIENASFTGMPTSVKNMIQNLKDDSDKEDSAQKEEALRTALNSLRNHSYFSKALVTTYTYDPLVGMTSMTDPKGNTTYYTYDAFNRLKQTKDTDRYLISENEYHYAH